MVQRFNIVLISICLLFGVSSCENEEVLPEDVNLGLEYYPLSLGDSWEYEVSRVDYLLTGGKDTTNYYLKEVVEDTTHDFDEISYHMYRYYRTDTTSAWDLDSIWQTKKSFTRLIRTENNIRYIKLVFPIEEGAEWDGNALNGQNGSETYEFDGVGSEFSVNGVDFEATTTVNQGPNFQTLIDTDFRSETFAKSVGLIYKYKRVLYHQPGDDTTGTLYIQKIIDYEVQ